MSHTSTVTSDKFCSLSSGPQYRISPISSDFYAQNLAGSRFSIRVDVHDRILTFADNLGVELAGEVLNRCRGPVQWQAPWFVSEPVSQSFA
jgi:hypothetical protein